MKPALAVTCAAAALALAVGCSKPKPPTITPRSAKVTAVSLQGIDIEAQLIAYNPNDIDLSVKSVEAKVVLDKRFDVGTFKETKPILLPAKKRTNVKVPVQVRWADVMGVAELATSGRDIDYLVDGKADIGGDVVSVTLPFQITGTVTHAQLMKAAGGAVPNVKLPF
ncbi:MAG TPA: LEA type 2 family protein [Minicystis sp.]|nr:LEA type 2 family protein [Minicystis sp.]